MGSPLASSLGGMAVEPQSRSRGRHTSVPRSDSDEEVPEFWGEEAGSCVSRRGRVRASHEFLEGWTCIFCDATLAKDGSISLKRPAVDLRAAPTPPRATPAPAPPSPAPARGRPRKVEDDEVPTIECGNCGGVNEKFFMGHKILKCMGCGFDFDTPDPEDEPEAPRRRASKPAKARKLKKGKR